MEKKTVCLYFQVHQPVHLRKYQFFDIGKRHDYYDEFINRNTVQRAAYNCYLPANKLLLDLIKEYGSNFKVSFSITGIAIEQFEKYAPEVIDSFKALASTGCVEFLAETYSHSLASLTDEKEFKSQVEKQSALIKKITGKKPVTFRNTEFIYTDEIGATVAKMGFSTMLTEGAKHILGWKSPDFVYTNSIHPKLKLLLRNPALSDDIALRFSDRSWSEWPLTAEKYAQWILDAAKDHDVVNLFMNYEIFGLQNTMDTGIFSFLSALPGHLLSTSAFEFLTPDEAARKHQPVAPLHVPFPISWTDEERDITAWLGNELQEEAFEQLYKIRRQISGMDDVALSEDYVRLQDSYNLYYMCTKLFATGGAHISQSPYASPYEAFINYMNVLSDFIDRVDRKQNTISKSPEIEPKTPPKKEGEAQKRAKTPKTTSVQKKKTEKK